MASGTSGFTVDPADLHNSGSTLESFGDQVADGGQRLSSLGERLVSHTSQDSSGVGHVISTALGRGMDVAGSVFREGGRVAGAAGKRLHGNATNHAENEATQTAAFRRITTGGDADHLARPQSGATGGPRSTSGRAGGNSGPRSATGATGPHRPADPRTTATPAASRDCVSDPVDVATGAVVITESDLRIADPLPLALTRTHVSGHRAGRLFGASWAATLDQRLEIDDAGVCFVADDGMILVYPQPTTAAPVLPVEGPRWPLAVDPSGDYRLRAGDRTLWFSTRTGARRQIVELDAITGSGRRRIDIRRDRDGLPLELRHSTGYRAMVRCEAGHVTELHVVGGDRLPGVAVPVLCFRYDEHGRLVEQADASGRPARYSYDRAGRITGWQDRTGTAYSYEYDADGRCVRTLGTDGFLNASFVYHAPARTTAFTNSLGHTSQYTFDANHRTIRQIDPLGAVTTFERDRYGRLRSRTDPLGRTTRFDYRADAHDTLAVVTRPDGSRVAVDDRPGRPLVISLTADNGFCRRAYPPDASPNPLTEAVGVATTPDAFAAALGTPATRRPAGSRDVDTDAFGRPTTGVDGWGRRTELGWTVAGQLAWRTPTPTDRELTLEGERERTSERWRYDADGREIERVDPLGQSVRHEYGPFGLRTATIDAAGARTGYAYDTELRLVAVTNPHGQTWHYGYDPAGRLVASVDFDGRRQTFDYDAAGQVVRAVNAAGQAVEYGYDILGNLTEVRTDTGTTAFRYDPVGQLVAAVSPDAELTMVRDARGRVTAHTVNGRTTTFDYRHGGRTLRRRTPSGVDSEWALRADGGPLRLTVAGHTLAFQHDGNGREYARQWDESVVVGWTVHPDQRAVIQSVTPVDSPAAPTWYQRYDYRVDGHIAGIEDRTGGYTRFTLDPHGRITEAAAPDHVERYAYDALGTLLTVPDAQDEHDAQGRLVRRVVGGRTWQYTWDALDRLTAVTTPTGERWRYTYDPLGRRLAKQRLDAAGDLAEEVRFSWDGAQLVEQVHTDATGSRVTTWEYHPEDDRPLTQFTADASGARCHAIVTDPIGTPVEMFDTDGIPANLPRGTVWGLGPSEMATPLRFPGQYHDAETGLHYNVCRYYDPTTARYLTADPLGLAPAPNPLAYVPNPLRLADPLGLTCSAPSTSSHAPATPAAPAGPHLITTAGSARKPGVTDDQFNDPDHELDDDPELQAAADHSWTNPGDKHASEALGEAGAVSYLKAHTGYDDIKLHHATTTDPHTQPTTPGQRWSHAVAYGSSGVADVTYWDGQTLHVVEAKGGGSDLGDRQQKYFHQPTSGQAIAQQLAPHYASNSGALNNIRAATQDRQGNWKTFGAGEKIPQAVKDYGGVTLHQGTPEYLTDIGHQMANSPVADGRQSVGQAIVNHGGNVHYVPVSTSVDADGELNLHTMDPYAAPDED